MTVSGIGQGMAMSLLYGMQKPGASDMVSKILEDLDTNGDGSLSADEISSGKSTSSTSASSASSTSSSTSISAADTNNDGVVSLTELMAYLENSSSAFSSSSSETQTLLNSLV